MSIFRIAGRDKASPKVHYSQYIKTENKLDEAGSDKAETAKPDQSEAK